MKRVACLVPYPPNRVPGQRFRLEQWAQHMPELGYELEFVPLMTPRIMDLLYEPGHTVTKALSQMKGLAHRVGWAFRRASTYDAVVVHREALLLGIDWIERLLSTRVPTVYDFDDAVWLPNVSEANRRFRWVKGFSKIGRILASVGAVSAGCDYLANYARRYNSNVFVTPTSIDLVHYGAPRAHTNGERLVIGWTGSKTTAPYVSLVRDVLRETARRFPIKLIVLGANLEIAGVPLECIPWSPEAEVRTIRRFDVGVKPSPKEDWVRGKCPMKDIQYMALGIPCVATKFGTALESIDHGRTGYLSDSPDDWIAAFSALRDAGLRAEMGAAARATVEARYSSRVAAESFARALDQACSVFAA